MRIAGRPEPRVAGPRRRAEKVVDAPSDVLALPQPDWLFHHLSVSGPGVTLLQFRQAAVGPGLIPWERDHAALEEDLFLLLMRDRQRGGSGLGAASARTLAGRVSQLVRRREARALSAEAPRSLLPFDLNALLPLPPDLLVLGPEHPAPRRWLWQHWGTTRTLRGVEEVVAESEGKGPLPNEPAVRLRFWSADWSPWPAMRALATRWPELRFTLRPIYDLG